MISFSIVVPTRNRPGCLARCLESLASLDYPRNKYQVIVVDDGGSSSPDAIVDRFKSRLEVTLIPTAHRGPAAARNAGVTRARFDHLAFIDDDCTAHAAWLRVIAERLVESPRSAVGGRVINALDSNRYSRASQGLQDFLYRWYHEDGKGDLPFFTTNNLAVARDDFDRIGEFDATFPFASEDRDWCDRATHDGLELRYTPDAIVYHWHELSFSRFLQQHYRYGQGAVHFHSRRARRRGDRIRLEQLGFYRGMFTAPFVNRRHAPVSEALLMFVSQSASLAGFATELARSHGGAYRLSTLAKQP